MGTSTRTKGTRQLFVEIAEAIRERLDTRVSDERRTLRAVVERALTYYMDSVPLESGPSMPAPEQPRRGRPPAQKPPAKRTRTTAEREPPAAAEEPINPRRRKGVGLGHEAINLLARIYKGDRREPFQAVLDFIKLPDSEREKVKAEKADDLAGTLTPMQRASGAIWFLKAIPQNDQLRDRGFELVSEWVEGVLGKQK